MTGVLVGAENRCSGIPTIRREMAAHNLPEPVFENRRNEFVVTLYNQVQDTPAHSSDPAKTLLEFCKEPRSRKEIAAFLGLKTASYATERYIRPMLEPGTLEMTIPDKPKSTNQKYKTVSK